MVYLLKMVIFHGYVTSNNADIVRSYGDMMGIIFLVMPYRAFAISLFSSIDNRWVHRDGIQSNKHNLGARPYILSLRGDLLQ